MYIMVDLTSSRRRAPSQFGQVGGKNSTKYVLKSDVEFGLSEQACGGVAVDMVSIACVLLQSALGGRPRHRRTPQ